MASSVPSFIQKSANYEELFSDEEDKLAPIEAIPVSQMRDDPNVPEKPSASSKRKLPFSTSESSKMPHPRSSQKNKALLPQKSANSGPYMRKFFDMTENQIPEEAVAKWDKMTLVEAAKAIPLANAQSFFHYLKHGEEIVEAARGEQKLAEEVKQLKASIKIKDEEKKKLTDTGRKLKSSETKLLKERDQLNATVATLNSEKEKLEAFYAERACELELQVENLNTALATERSFFKAQKKARYEHGYKNGVNDYMKSTIAVFPDLDWTLLGEDAVKQVEDIKKKEAAKATEGAVSSVGKETDIPMVEAEGVPQAMDSSPEEAMLDPNQPAKVTVSGAPAS